MGAAGCKEAIKVWDFSGMEGGRIFTDQNVEEEQERKRGDSEVKRRRR